MATICHGYHSPTDRRLYRMYTYVKKSSSYYRSSLCQTKSTLWIWISPVPMLLHTCTSRCCNCLFAFFASTASRPHPSRLVIYVSLDLIQAAPSTANRDKIYSSLSLSLSRVHPLPPLHGHSTIDTDEAARLGKVTSEAKTHLHMYTHVCTPQVKPRPTYICIHMYVRQEPYMCVCVYI